jgi:hypothetical protein
LGWSRDYPEFKSSLGTSLRGLEQRKRDCLKDLGLGSTKAANSLFCCHRRKLVLEPVQKAPSRQDVTNWLKAKEENNPEPLNKTRVLADVAAASDDDHDVADFDVEEAVNQSQWVVRVRRDSGDSLGSELSQTPPSSPTKREGIKR